jgi:SET domain-containing protein
MDDIFVRLAPSGIHGVGVFAVTAIPPGGTVQLWSNEELRFVRKPVEGVLRDMVLAYGVEAAEGFWCPQDFNRAEIGWYINHADAPNMTYADDITLKALRRIEPGEELTVNYLELEGEFHDTVDAGAPKRG